MCMPRHMFVPESYICSHVNIFVHLFEMCYCLFHEKSPEQVYDHRIFRYIENPTESLSSVKDDEHIVAYRLPKRVAQLTRLEISHRYQEK